MTSVSPADVYNMTLGEATLLTEAAQLKRSREWDHTALLAGLISKAWFGKKGKGPDHFHPFRKSSHRKMSTEDRKKVIEAFAIDTIEDDVRAISKRRDSGKGIENSMKIFRRKWRLSPEMAHDIVSGITALTADLKMNIRKNMEEKAHGKE